MQYLCIVYAGAATNADPVDEGTIKDAYIEQDHKLFRAGKVLMASPLQAPETAVSIHYRDGVRSRTDGPYLETKEFIAGFLVIEAANMDEAVTIATDGPYEGFVNYEIRPLLDEKHSVTGQDRSAFFVRRA